MRLSKEIGAPHSDYLEEDLSMRQVSDWVEFYNEEPWGYDAIDTRNALLALVTAQSHGMKNVKLDTFRLRPPRVDNTPKEYELASKVRAIFKVPRT